MKMVLLKCSCKNCDKEIIVMTSTDLLNSRNETTNFMPGQELTCPECKTKYFATEAFLNIDYDSAVELDEELTLPQKALIDESAGLTIDEIKEKYMVLSENEYGLLVCEKDDEDKMVRFVHFSTDENRIKRYKTASEMGYLF